LKALINKILLIEQWEVQEQLLKILPRLSLSFSQKEKSLVRVKQNFSHKSAIVRTCALQALFDFSQHDSSLQAETRKVIEALLKDGPKSVQARARILIKQL